MSTNFPITTLHTAQHNMGVTARLSAVVTALRYENVVGNGRIVRETIRVCNGALDPLSEALDELSALENALEDRLELIEQTRLRCARRASLRQQHN